MSKEGWREWIRKNHYKGVTPSDDAKEQAIDAMFMDSFDTGYDFMQKHNQNGNLNISEAVTEDAATALRDAFDLGVRAFLKDKEAS